MLIVVQGSHTLCDCVSLRKEYANIFCMQYRGGVLISLAVCTSLDTCFEAFMSRSSMIASFIENRHVGCFYI